MTTITRTGRDVSSNDGHPIDWVALADSGADWVCRKLTEGATYTDRWALSDVEECRATGRFELGGYHFARPENNRPAAEVANFLRTAGPAGLIGNLWLDFERAPKSPVLDWGYLQSWLDEFYSLLPFQGIYWDRDYRNHLIKPQFALDWVAAPTANRPPGADVWQFGQGGSPGMTGAVDLNYVFFDRPSTTRSTAPMYQPPLVLRPIVADCACPTGGAWAVGDDGGVYAFGGAPFHGAPAGQAYWVGRTPALIECSVVPGKVYDVVDTVGERYSYPL